MADETTRVLVVDDERFQREAIADVLAEAGLATQLAASGREAIEAASDPAIAAVVLDIELPDLSGLEVFRRLREQRADLPVVVLSGHTSQEYVLEALRLGAFDYLAKPLHEEELRLALRRALESHRVAVGWQRLQRRVGVLAGALEALWARARGGAEGERALQEALVAAAAELLGAERSSLALLDAGGSALRVVAACGFLEPLAALPPAPPERGVAGLVLLGGEAVAVADAGAEPRLAERVHPERYRSRSFVAAPVTAGAGAFGVLCATERRGGEPFGEEDAALLRVLIAQAAPLLRAARRAEAEPSALLALLGAEGAEDASADAELARAICDAVVAEAEGERLLEAALRAAAEGLGAACVALHLASADAEWLVREAQAGLALRSDRLRLPRGVGLVGTVFETGQLVASAEPAAEPRFEASVDTPEDGVAAPLLCGPIRFRERRLGVFRAFLAPGARPGPRTAEVLSAALSAAVRTALLYRSLVASVEDLARARREGSAGSGSGRPGSGGSGSREAEA